MSVLLSGKPRAVHSFNLLAGAADGLFGAELDVANLTMSSSTGRSVYAQYDVETGDFRFNTAQFNDLNVGQSATVTVTHDVVSANGAMRGNSASFTVTGADDNVITGTASRTTADDLNGTFGDDVLFTRHGNDRIVALDGNDAVFASFDNDTVYGGKGNDLIHGGAQHDLLFGGLGDDVLFGDRDRDTLDGGDGNDILVGGLFNDELTGGAGADAFVFTDQAVSGERDVITDFTLGEEALLLDGVAIVSLGLADADGDGFIDDTVVIFDTGAVFDLIGVITTAEADLLL